MPNAAIEEIGELTTHHMVQLPNTNTHTDTQTHTCTHKQAHALALRSKLQWQPSTLWKGVILTALELLVRVCINRGTESGRCG